VKSLRSRRTPTPAPILRSGREFSPCSQPRHPAPSLPRYHRGNITDWALEQFRSHYPPSPSGTSSTTATPPCTTQNTANAKPPTPAANFRQKLRRAPPPNSTANPRRESPPIPFARATLSQLSSRRSEGSAVLPRAEKLQIPRSARDDKSKAVSANSASSAARDVVVFRGIQQRVGIQRLQQIIGVVNEDARETRRHFRPPPALRE